MSRFNTPGTLKRRPFARVKSAYATLEPVRRWITRVFAGIGFIIVLYIVIIASQLQSMKPTALPESVMLTYHFKDSLAEVSEGDFLTDLFAPPSMNLYEATQIIRSGVTDQRIKALAVRISDGDYSMTSVQALRSAIKDFRASGKKAYAYAESFGDFSNGMMEYYLASAFDEIWLMPTGTVSLTGFGAEVPYLADALDTIGVNPQIYGEGEYKTAPEPVLRNDMSDAQRETLESLLGDMTSDFYAGLKDRGVSTAQIEQVMAQSPLTPEQAMQLGLVDKVDYLDSYSDYLESDEVSLGGKMTNIENVLPHYRQSRAKAFDKAMKKNDVTAGKKIALMYLEGAIMPSDESGGGFGGPVISAEEVAGLLYDIADDKTVGAVVLRINSPGGSPTASEMIHRAIADVKENGKTVVVSMGEAAASGGYWISTNADHIYAQAATITGSIGVFGGKIDLSELWGKLNVNWERVSTHERAFLWSENSPYTVSEKLAIEEMLAKVYDDFLDRVAEGRKMTREEAAAVAEGRAWSGKEAYQRGLVDYIGGLSDALDLAARQIGYTDRNVAPIFQWPQPKSALEMLTEFTEMGPSLSIAEKMNYNDLMPESVRELAYYSLLASRPELSAVLMPPILIH